jgi:hypothetical protein
VIVLNKAAGDAEIGECGFGINFGEPTTSIPEALAPNNLHETVIHAGSIEAY